jgi:hypothetical protein
LFLDAHAPIAEFNRQIWQATFARGQTSDEQFVLAVRQKVNAGVAADLRLGLIGSRIEEKKRLTISFVNQAAISRRVVAVKSGQVILR